MQLGDSPKKCLCSQDHLSLTGWTGD